MFLTVCCLHLFVVDCRQIWCKVVTMQAHKVAPPDMICKDKFLGQCTVVPAGTTDEDINSSMVSSSVSYI